MAPQKTHRESKRPQVSARHLADYMAATETAKRTIIRSCKYQTIARVVQHDEAKQAVGRFLRTQESNIGILLGEAQNLRGRMADDDFERDLFDHNADYIDRFASVCSDLVLPDADRIMPGKALVAEFHGVRVPFELQFRLRRLTKTNKIRVGGAMLRYRKGRALDVMAGLWQSALLLGVLRDMSGGEAEEPEAKLCITIDAYAGVAHAAPSDSISRYNNMVSACATIAERWPNIKPPAGASL